MFRWFADWLRCRRVKLHLLEGNPVRKQTPLNQDMKLLAYYLLQTQIKPRKK